MSSSLLKVAEMTSSVITSYSIHYTKLYDALADDLARLDLTRLIALTSQSTYSASELTINGLKPYLQVVQIGEATGGKPYGIVITSYSIHYTKLYD